VDHIRLLRQFRSYRQDSAGQALHSASRFGFPPSPLQSYLGSSELHHCPEIGLESGSDCGSVASCSLMLSVGGFPLSTAKIVALLLIQVTGVGLPVHFSTFSDFIHPLFIGLFCKKVSRDSSACFARRVFDEQWSSRRSESSARHPGAPASTTLHIPSSATVKDPDQLATRTSFTPNPGSSRTLHVHLPSNCNPSASLHSAHSAVGSLTPP
jgi:hypothetical protein